MTSQKDQIQRLIAEIEATLAKPASRLPLGLSGETERQRQLLGKLFSYLQSLEELFDSPGGWGPINPETGEFASSQPVGSDMEASASQVLQGLLSEMKYLRENSLRPMRQELETLQQKRDSLQAEINVLEAQHGFEPLQSEQQINAFLETLMQRLQEQLSAQMVQNFAAMETATIEQLSAADNPAPLLSGQRLEQVRLLQAQSDQLLLKLDSTLTAVFDSLQRSVDSYRESLEEGLDQMHGLGRQGEVIFHAFINHLAQQLGQDASLYLTGELGEAVQQAALQGPNSVTTDVDLNATQLDELDQALEDLALEEATGIEAPDADLQIDPDLALLEDAIAPDEDITAIQSNDFPELELLENSFLSNEAVSGEDADIDENEDITVIQTDQNFNPDIEIDLDEDITLIQTDTAFDLDLIEAATSSSSEVTLDDVITDSDIESPDLPLFETEATVETETQTQTATTEPEETPTSLTPEAPELTPEASEPLNLDLALEDIDESLGLLATGMDSDPTLSANKPQETLDQDELPSIDSENELFKFDADFDLGLELEAEEEPDELLAAELFPEEPIDSEERSIDLSNLNWTEISETENIEQPTETDLHNANQVADDWLFERLEADDTTAEDSTSAQAPVIIDPIAEAEEVLSETKVTVETLFGDSIETQDDSNNEPPNGDTITSLSDLLPDESTLEAVEDFPENVPDDVYIAASADEDLINLVDSGAEQRLLIDFDDEQLVEQLDEDLQKLAGDTFSADYGVEEDEALDPLDQATLETIVRDLNLEDLDLDNESAVEAIGPEATGESGLATATSTESLESDDDSETVALSQPPVEEDADRDLFEGFAGDVVDIDDPSEDEIDLTTITSSPDESDQGPQDIDLLGLVTDPLINEYEDFDDGLTDSLADELGDLSERSNTLSQESTEDFVGQLLSDLEEPVIEADEDIVIPAVEETDPQLDSASLPDVPLDSATDDLDTAAPPEPDDFLQAEQEAFWQTMTTDDTPEGLVSETTDSSDDSDLAEVMFDIDIDFESSSTSVPSDELEDLLVLDDLSQPSDDQASAVVDQASAVVDVEESDVDVDLGDLNELFEQSVTPDLEGINHTEANDDVEQASNPLAELGLDEATDLENLLLDPEDLVPEVDTLSVLTEDVLPTVDSSITADSVEQDVAAASELTAIDPPVSPPPLPEPSVDIEGDWFLGLDVGSTGLSAVLMNRRTGQVYPLYWQTEADDTKHFRLPALAVVTAAQDTVAVGYDALGDLSELLGTAGAKMPDLVGVNRLKPLLKVAVGHGQTLADSEPWLRWSDTVELPMLQVLQAMVSLLKYMVDRGQAVGLEGDALAQIWQQLQGVIVGYPTNWPDTYSFNLREAVLAAGLSDQPEQILFVEDAIATILSGLPDPNNASLAETVSLSRQPSLYNCQWQEDTVIISGGAVMTELGLVHLPKDLSKLNYADFALRGFAYGGDALDQDIVCQLLLPTERRQPLSEADAGIDWDWQGHIEPETADWSQLQLDGLTLPAVGHVDWAQRYQLQQRLLSSSLGQSLLAAARHLKLTLQQQNQMQLTLAGQRWLIKRRHLENLIFLPYIQRINRYLNVLLSHHSVDTQAIKQVICTGGSASLPAIARWLRQKFPNATIIQDTYASELPHSCSRVAYGLVNLARYPQVLNVTRQQYSDYFLLVELLRVFPQQPLPVGAIMHLLEQRGINTQACHLHILALLEGHLPPGLVPTAADRGLICDRTTDLPTYRALLQTPLFSKTVTESGGQIYIPNEAQAKKLLAYVNQLLTGKVQTLEEPLIAQLEVFAQ
ncbi:hypothetical protein N836_23765 [Leptolyngbya sp. Heron Island J]|uniref:hypothetical protein n=1 Tax=Leptolyngbya sp. Heron Island J TaxID=1385935 RepID=UPI0003B9B9C4|nr:hypothetical protein [Leptolyngbya sp. Heron Island J]ESA33084.1 hypothetical protein N836_23765 [Leptolyngbya sp. Heron Island J]